jgi:Domain of unknown function (DUF1844)
MNRPDAGKTRFDPSSFVALVTGLGAQAQILLGVIENPLTKKKDEVDLERAQNVIALIEMLEEKTRGNLTEEEAGFLTRILADLRMRWVDAKSAAE